jgi:DhnA-type fructose-1,6-bisphosphate aldolase and related enzymes
MSQLGKDFRLAQIINQKSNRQVCVAMDHSPAIGPCEGLIDPVATIAAVCEGKPDTIFTHFGNIKKAMPVLAASRTPFLLSITTATTKSADPSRVYLVDSVEHALLIGACGVSMRIFVGAPYDYEMIQNLARVAEECEKLGMPLMAMMYPYGSDNMLDPEHLKHAARIGAELGADIVKTYYTGDPQTFKQVTEACPGADRHVPRPKSRRTDRFSEHGQGRAGRRRHGNRGWPKRMAEQAAGENAGSHQPGCARKCAAPGRVRQNIPVLGDVYGK